MQKHVNLGCGVRPESELAPTVLMALHLQLNWEGQINLVTATLHQTEERKLHHFLERLGDQARLP